MIDGGGLLRRAREAASLTQRELAARAGTRQAAISQVERGEVSVTLDRLERLMRLCGYELHLRVAPHRMNLDEDLFLHSLRMLPEERLELTIELSRFGLAMRAAGERAASERLEQELQELRDLARV